MLNREYRGRKQRVAAVVQNAIQFFVPHYRHIVRDGRFDLKVFYLSDRGLKPFNYHGTIVSQEEEAFRGYDWTILRNWSPFRGSHGALENFDPSLYVVLRKERFDAVWFHGYNHLSNWVGFLACVRNNIPILLRGESENFFPRPMWKETTKRILLSSLFRRVDGFLYIGKYNRDFYKGYGVPDEKLFSVPYGVDNEWFRGQGDDRLCWRKEIRQSLGLKDDTVVFINFSKHRHPKRPEDAVQAFCRLSPFTDAALIMLGDGELRKRAERIYRETNHGHRVFFLGFRPYSELRRYLAASDVMVFPSEENWGMAINEAIAAELAVVASDRVAGVADMVHHGGNGYVYTSRCIDELTTYLKMICANPSCLPGMKRASGVIANGMSFQVMTDGLVEALNFVTKGSRGSS